jgi:hypothetical protein
MTHKRYVMFYSREQLNRNEIVGWEIVLRDFLVDILRGCAKNSRCLSWLRFPNPSRQSALQRFQLLRAHRAANEANGDKMDAKRPQL